MVQEIAGKQWAACIDWQRFSCYQQILSSPLNIEYWLETARKGEITITHHLMEYIFLHLYTDNEFSKIKD